MNSTAATYNVVSTHFYPGVVNSLATHRRSLPNDLLIEILSRLPVKTLLRFESVCKPWLSLIKEDSHLIDLQFNRSKSRPYILYINRLEGKGLLHTSSIGTFEESNSLQKTIPCEEILGGCGGDEELNEFGFGSFSFGSFCQIKEPLLLEPVNGLVCFVDEKTHGIKVYNASTREATPWVKSTLLAEENAKLATKNIQPHSREIYQFGFDPEKREHKVFCFWRLSIGYPYGLKNPPDYESWEALTLGADTKWRRINAVPNENNQIKIKEVLPPPHSTSRRQVYADGTIYWSNKDYFEKFCIYYPNTDPDVIVAFDVGSEKYRLIPIPNFILDEPRKDQRFMRPIGMLVLGVHVALVYQMKPYVIKLWMLNDGADKKLENCRGNQSNWSSETITLPFSNVNWRDGFGIAGCSNKILFECREDNHNENSVCFYSYDRGRKTCQKIEMDGDPSIPLPYSGRSLVATFTESLFPVSASRRDQS